jgi:hypothetical protein
MPERLNEENNDEVSETCGGTGEVTTMETVYPGEPHQAPIGTAPCPDCSPEPDYDDQDE